MNNQTVREVNVRDMFYRVLKKWRRILCGAVALALVLGFYRLGTALRSMSDPLAAAENQKKYQIELSEYEVTKKKLEAQVNRTRSSLEDKKAYCEQSVFLQIDPLNAWVGSTLVYIDFEESTDKMAEPGNAGRAGSLTAAYDAYLTNGELFQEIVQHNSRIQEASLAEELLTTEADADSSTIRITCIGDSEAFVQDMMGLIKQGLEKKHQELRASLGEHRIAVLTEGSYTIVDKNLFEQQEDRIEFFERCAQANQEAEKELTALKEPAPSATFETGRLVKQALSGMLIGLFVGLFLMVFFYAVRYVFSRTAKSENDWKTAGLSVLAQIQVKTGKRRFGKLDRWISRRLMGTDQPEEDEGYALAADKLCAILHEKGANQCAVISDLPDQIAKPVVEKLNVEGTGISCVWIGNLLTDPKALRRLEGSKEFVFLGKNEVTACDNVRRQITLLHACGKDLLGAIVLE